MRIITVSREFGSGGRELGKRLAEYMGIDYYDSRIIEAIADRCGVSEDYADYMLTHSFPSSAPILTRQSLHVTPEAHLPPVELMRAEAGVIKGIAAAGRDCVIVGRNANVLLKDYSPYDIFVCADTASKLKRCRERAQPDENFSDRVLLSKMKMIDRNRKRDCEMISDFRWGNRTSYRLIVNTSGCTVKLLIPGLAALIRDWFENRGTENA